MKTAFWFGLVLLMDYMLDSRFTSYGTLFLFMIDDEYPGIVYKMTGRKPPNDELH